MFFSLNCPHYAIFCLPCFSAQSSPLEVSRLMCVSTPGGFIVQAGHSSGAVTCRTGTQIIEFTVRPTQKALPALTCFPKLDQLIQYQRDMILPPLCPPSTISSVCWIGIVGPFCVEALVKWAIIPIGESDDDFWQNAATAPCQTISLVAISSHGRTRTHRHARRLTPQTSCFSLGQQT